MKTAFSWIIAGALVLSFANISFAQQQQTPAAAPSATATKPATSDAAKKAKAKECSDQADAKGLHGKARKEFRSKCKRG